MDAIKDAWRQTPTWVRFVLALLGIESAGWLIGQGLTAAFQDDSVIRLPALFISNPYVIAVTFGALLSWPLQLLWKRLFSKRPKLHIGAFAKYKRTNVGQLEGVDFIVRVQAFGRLTNGKIYAQVARMASDWSGEQIVWQGGDSAFGVQIGEFNLLRAGEHHDILVGSRGPEAADPLNILGTDLDKDKNTFPIDRLAVSVVSDEVREEKGFGILAPGYVYNAVIPLAQVPVSKDVYSKLLEP